MRTAVDVQGNIVKRKHKKRNHRRKEGKRYFCGIKKIKKKLISSIKNIFLNLEKFIDFQKFVSSSTL